MHKKIEHFIETIKREAKDVNVKIILPKSKTVITNGVKVDGYFDDIDLEFPVLKCPVGKPRSEWLPVLVHEYSHLRQYIEKCSEWQESDKEKSDVIFEWINGKDFHLKKLKLSFRRTVEIELDCEKRSVEHIKAFDLPINVDDYIRKANSLLFFYNYVFTVRRWYKISPFAIPKVYNKFRKDFKADYNSLPNKYVKLYEQYCI